MSHTVMPMRAHARNCLYARATCCSNLLYRRIHIGMDKDGNLLYKLSKAAAAYHLYRSSNKNTMRLPHTETNMARAADHNRWLRMDFAIGQHVILSNNHTLNSDPSQSHFYPIPMNLKAPIYFRKRID